MVEILDIYNKLLKEYNHQGWWPINSEYHPKDYFFPKNKKQEFEICIGAILTQSTSWKNVEKTLENLKKNNSLSPEIIDLLSTENLSKLIKSSGYHKQKARKLKEFTRFYLKNKEKTRETLLEIWGIGKETADSMLLYAYRKPRFVIDAYTRRIMGRLGFKEKKYDDLQKLFVENLKNDHMLFNEFHALLVEHGKKTCKKSPLCSECCLNKICSYHKKFIS